MDFFNKMISDIDGEISSKRTIAFLAFTVMIGSWVASTFFGKPIDPIIFDGFLYVVVVGLGVVAAEKFSRK